ncbi:CHAT domain-containing protein [Saccharothrix lopnurensis]|uniref:CHAT domain-containing protein n=1 Tax=Saccharothrix lopnurensis TaxID=1670621 RepID=A0ABW1NY23_9PSEU
MRLSPDRLEVGRVAELTVELTNDGDGPCSHIVVKLALPQGVVLLGGGVRVEVLRLLPGEGVTRVLKVRPTAEGLLEVGSSNFSYRDRWGTPHRVREFRASLEVVAARTAGPPPEPRFAVSLLDHELPVGQWSQLRGRVTNTGIPVLVGTSVQVSGAMEVDPRSAHQSLGTLPPAETAEFVVHVRPTSSGSHVPVHVVITVGTDGGAVRREPHTLAVRVTDAPARDEVGQEVVRILHLSAGPADLGRMRLDDNVRAIRETLRLALDRDRYRLEARGGVRARDLTQALLDVRPHVVHFSGHGLETGGLVVQNEVGMSRPLTVAGVAALFKEVNDTVRCVVLDACHSAVLAEAVVEHVDFVVTMRREVSDPAAIAFGIGFYQALATNAPVEKAFNLGCVGVRLDELTSGEADTPLLLKRKG